MLSRIFLVSLRICRLIVVLPSGRWRSVTKDGVTSTLLLPSNNSISVWLECVYDDVYEYFLQIIYSHQCF